MRAEEIIQRRATLEGIKELRVKAHVTHTYYLLHILTSLDMTKVAHTLCHRAAQPSSAAKHHAQKLYSLHASLQNKPQAPGEYLGLKASRQQIK